MTFLAMLVIAYFETGGSVNVKEDGSIAILKKGSFLSFFGAERLDFFSVFRRLIDAIGKEKQALGLSYPEALCAKALIELTTEDNRERVIELLMLAHLTMEDPEVESIEDDHGKEIKLQKIRVGKFKQEIDISDGLAKLLSMYPGCVINFDK